MYTITENEIESLIQQGNKSNANMAYNPETIHKYVADSIMKQHALENLPLGLKMAHKEGELHIHDLEYFMSRSLNCLISDLRYFAKYGLKVDGSGDHTSVAGPPRRLSTVMNHTGEILLSAQQDMSGGQGMTLWNVFAAPYAEDMTYSEVKEAVQQLVFNLNMAYASRGGQVPFTTIGLEFGVPDFLQDEPAIGPGGETCGVYGDYHVEAKLLERAFTEILMEGDYNGKPHLFPNTTYTLRKEYMKDEYDEQILEVHKLSAKFGSPYFINMLPKYQGVHTDYMGCRTRLSTDWTGNWETDTMRTGNMAYVTINLPRMALESAQCNEEEVEERIGLTLEKAHDILLLRRERALKCMDNGLFPFICQRGKEGMYYNFDDHTLSFGFCGMDELCRLVTGKGLGDKNAERYAMSVLDLFETYKDEYRNDGLRWSVIQTPAESTSHRFANLDMKDFPDKVIFKGTPKAPYYTNSCHLPVDTEYSLPDKIRWESRTHPLTGGGHIFHAFMGEAYSDPESLVSLTEKIIKTDIGFYAYSIALSHCMECYNTMSGLQEKCSNCGNTEDIEWYDRITGYVQQVGHSNKTRGGWNDGKRQELLDRKRW